ncbi:TonB-dependent receptor [Parabacteroides acidifaciens]|nr:TonB-dependent receptor [Parabacteroides acidifaciens]MBC8603118.1 TonB-dependent receptor [Parabacteroides acidifaciens]
MRKILNLSRQHDYRALTCILLCLVFHSLCFLLHAQNVPITGVVKDAAGEAIVGANVVEKGTTNGTITDMEGKFSLNVTLDATLVISYIGYIQQEVKVRERRIVNIILEEDTYSLEEVVAIGYGTVKKQDLTGSVASVDGSKLADRKSMRVSQALQGAVSGVRVSRSGSDPSSSATIRVRGITSINNTDPLVIVDGVPGTLDWVNPEDIESISVLKDAASASIYGSRAAAGVILVTTKRAKKGTFNINYNYEFSLDKPTTTVEYADAQTYMRMINERDWNDKNNQGNQYTTYSQESIDNYATMHLQNPDQYPDVDWMNIMMKKKSTKQSHKLNIIGGTEKLRTKITAEYDQSDALYKGKNYDRMMFRANNDIYFNDWIDASIDVNGIYSISESPARYTMTATRRLSAPIYAAEWSDGRIAEGKTGENPYALLVAGGSKQSKTLAVGGKMAVNIKPFEGLKITGVFAPQFYRDKQKTFAKSIPYTYWNDPNTTVGYIMGATKTTLTESRPDNMSTTTQLFVNYTKSFKEHNFNVMAGYENYYYYDESMSGSRDNYLLQSFPYLDIGNANYQYATGSAYQNAYRSWFGRIMYNWKSRYYLQANARYDGSSRFAKDFRWGFFPSFSAGWVISEESFMKDKLLWLSSLKLRGSWGQLGNERIGNYPYQSTIAFQNDILLYQGNEVVAGQAAGVYKYAIRDISWETTESWDIGLDAYFLNNRLRFSGDYYKKQTKDMLLALEIPDYVGLENPDQNTGKMHTKGWDIELSWNDQIGDFSYSATFNLSDAKSIMGDLGGTEFLGDQVKKKGSEFNEWYGYLSDGIYQTQEEVDNSARMNSNVKPGDIKYVDVSGPDGVPDGKISPEYDRVLLGGSLPRFTYGGTINMAYKNVDLAIAFQGIGKQNVRETEEMVHPFEAQFRDVPQIIVGKYWSVLNTAEQNLKAEFPRISETGYSNNYTMSDYWLFNGGYFRLKNIVLGYTLPKDIVEKMKIQNLRVYANVSDLFSIDRYPKGYDPEAIGTYWVTTSFLFGISVQF